MAQHESLSYAVSQKHARPWSNDSVAPSLDSSSFPRSVNSYDASLRSTDLRHHSIYNSTTDMWPPSQPSSHWSEPSNISDQSWESILLPGIDNSDTKPIIHHQPQHNIPSIISGSCSPLSTISSLSPSPSPTPILQTTTHKISRKSKDDTNTSTVKICSHCHATSTPLWRREPTTLKTLCNACGNFQYIYPLLLPLLISLQGSIFSSEISSDHKNLSTPIWTGMRPRKTRILRKRLAPSAPIAKLVRPLSGDAVRQDKNCVMRAVSILGFEARTVLCL